ncbi:hypothetical protein SAMN02745220_00304 [Desulfopila aestuarii DSM 18488]|uniref:Uncharacterized protein n=1 Tax=Desulfopila aestuarii DSM 18488 TaxID=1121416 RepID=A0A1M7XWK7_9BACT|nr:hypothetical protein SAMN02745220_00304 [Desulfopila aestuarii DSM 18488]
MVPNASLLLYSSYAKVLRIYVNVSVLDCQATGYKLYAGITDVPGSTKRGELDCGTISIKIRVVWLHFHNFAGNCSFLWWLHGPKES